MMLISEIDDRVMNLLTSPGLEEHESPMQRIKIKMIASQTDIPYHR